MQSEKNNSLKNLGFLFFKSRDDSEITFGGDARFRSRINQSNYSVFLLRPRTTSTLIHSCKLSDEKFLTECITEINRQWVSISTYRREKV